MSPSLDILFCGYLLLYPARPDRESRYSASKQMCQWKHLNQTGLLGISVSMLTPDFLLAQEPGACSSNSISQDGSLAIFSCHWHHKILHHSGILANLQEVTYVLSCFLNERLPNNFCEGNTLIKSTTAAKSWKRIPCKWIVPKNTNNNPIVVS